MLGFGIPLPTSVVSAAKEEENECKRWKKKLSLGD
jgi:hypothetical protein